MPAHDPCEGDQADILAVGGVGQTAEERDNRRAEAVGHDAALELLVGRFAIRAAGRYAGDVADRLDRGDERHDDHQTDQPERGRRREFEAKPLVGQADPVGLGDIRDLARIEHPEGDRDQVADHDADEDRCGRPDPLAVSADHENGEDDEQGHRPVADVAEAGFLAETGGIGAAPGGIFDAHRQQGEPDRHHHDAGNEARDEPSDLRNEISEKDLEQPADKACAEDGRKAGAALDRRGEDSDVGEAGPLDDRKAGADGPDADSLDQRCDARRKQGDLDKDRDILGARGQGDEQRHRDVARKHGEDMLNAERNRFAHWRPVVGIFKLFVHDQRSVD